MEESTLLWIWKDTEHRGPLDVKHGEFKVNAFRDAISGAEVVKREGVEMTDGRMICITTNPCELVKLQAQWELLEERMVPANPRLRKMRTGSTAAHRAAARGHYRWE